MDIIAVLSNKGGAGKTTLATSLAVAAGENGHIVALIDLDPQASAAAWGDSREQESPAVVSAQAARLPRVLDAAREHGANLAILDTAPRSEETALKAARVADFVLLVARPSIHDLRALQHSADLLQLAQVPGAVVLNAVPYQGSHGEEATQVLSGMGLAVTPDQICHRAAHYNAATAGLTALEYEPKGKAAGEIRALWGYLADQLSLYRKDIS